MMIAYHRSIAWVVCAFNIMHQCTHLFINFESIEIWNLNEKTKTETNHGWLPTKQNENQKGDNENKTSETAILWFETSEERIYDRCDICRVVALVVVFASCQSRSWRRIESRKNLRGECWNFERKTSFFLFDCFACFFFKSKQNNNMKKKQTSIQKQNALPSAPWRFDIVVALKPESRRRRINHRNFESKVRLRRRRWWWWWTIGQLRCVFEFDQYQIGKQRMKPIDWWWPN